MVAFCAYHEFTVLRLIPITNSQHEQGQAIERLQVTYEVDARWVLEVEEDNYLGAAEKR